jgi:hypothetical protein
MEGPMEQNTAVNNKIRSMISNEEQKISGQYSRILASAVRRAAEAVIFFNEKGALSDNTVVKTFFLYLSVKKDAQRVIIEKIGRSLGIELTPIYYQSSNEAAGGTDEKAEEDLYDIFHIVHEVAADELEFYLNYAAVEKDGGINSLLLMLADLAKEFLFDIKIWYLNHKDANESNKPGFKKIVLQDYSVIAA